MIVFIYFFYNFLFSKKGKLQEKIAWKEKDTSFAN